MVEPKRKIVQTTIRVEASLHRRIADFVYELKRRDRKASIDALLQIAAREWLDTHDPEHAEIPDPLEHDDPRLRPWIELLRTILNSNHQVAIDAITRNLQAFAELVSAVTRKDPAIILSPEEIVAWTNEYLERHRSNSDQMAS